MECIKLWRSGKLVACFNGVKSNFVDNRLAMDIQCIGSGMLTVYGKVKIGCYLLDLFCISRGASFYLHQRRLSVKRCIMST